MLQNASVDAHLVGVDGRLADVQLLAVVVVHHVKWALWQRGRVRGVTPGDADALRLQGVVLVVRRLLRRLLLRGINSPA